MISLATKSGQEHTPFAAFSGTINLEDISTELRRLRDDEDCAGIAQPRMRQDLDRVRIRWQIIR